MTRPIKYRVARELRKNPTPAEALLWKHLRNRQFRGWKFLRQHPIAYGNMNENFFSVADFYCHEKRLIIEVDGSIHDDRKDKDAHRDHILGIYGYRVIRLTNEDVLKSPEQALSLIPG